MLRSLFAGALALAVSAVPALASDVAAGQKQFKLQCATCHSAAAGRNAVGPTLFGVIGRKAGTVPGFAYSVTNRTSGLTWDVATMNAYLTNPKAVVVTNKMTFAGVKDPEQRANVIGYLLTLH